ncbi:MAG: hypothetical protein O9284_03890 [Steroidobacteraceae bacterium]|jgi:uncharacterized membrane protein|nr:hypothetical protein [Steroidobacteraceae bacterium]
MQQTLQTTGVDPGLVTYAHAIYALHALSAVIGILTAASVVGAFIFGLPSIAAVIMNYVKRSDVRGTWLDSHFRWQIRTFWFAALWVVLAFVASAPLMLVLVGFFTFGLAVAIVGLWVIYRVVRGWVALKDGRTLPSSDATVR